MDAATLADKTVLVMGLGRFGGGVDAARFAAQAGARVLVTDLATQEQLGDSMGRHEPDDFATADVVVVNPAVPPDNEFLRIARGHDRLITSQIELFFQMCPATTVGITGANGKSTTTALAAHLLEKAPRRSGVAACEKVPCWLRSIRSARETWQSWSFRAFSSSSWLGYGSVPALRC